MTMEDQTDEDFFDNLVDDDYEPTHTATKVEEESDSDEAKAFANLSFDDTSGQIFNQPEVQNKEEIVEYPKPNTVEEPMTVSELVKPENNKVPSVSNAPASSVDGFSKSNVKEVGWNAFQTDATPNGIQSLGYESDFFNIVNDKPEIFFEKIDNCGNAENAKASVPPTTSNIENNGNYQPEYGGFELGTGDQQNSNDFTSWENMYPGWKFDPITEQWYQVDSFDVSSDSHSQGNHNVEKKDSIQMNSSLPGSETAVENTYTNVATTYNENDWNQVKQGTNDGYPEHMYFDPQYPGWYYDLLAQEWRSLDSYTPNQPSSIVNSQAFPAQNGMYSGATNSHYESSTNGSFMQPNILLQDHNIQGGNPINWNGSNDNSYNQQVQGMWQPESIANGDVVSNFGANQQQYGDTYAGDNFVNTFTNRSAALPFHESNQTYDKVNDFVGQQQFVATNNLSHYPNHYSYNDYYGTHNSAAPAQFSAQSNQQFSFVASSAYTSVGRPSHALVTFGFGGKLLVLKDRTSFTSNLSEDPATFSISVFNLMDVVTQNSVITSSASKGNCSYFHALSQHSLPGPLVGGSVGNKELNKWIEERIAHCESSDVDYSKGGTLKLLLSLLKIAYEHYGKLRSPFGVDSSSRENDSPEAAVAKLFASCRQINSHMNAYAAFGHCLQNLTSDVQIQEIATEVQNLLVSGRSIEALQCAQAGQLWGPALVLASQLGNQFFVDTIKQMALRQLVAGSPLRTLCLLIAGEPKEIFTSGTVNNNSSGFAISRQSMEPEANLVLNGWEENLAVIAANRTKDDELVIMHLGDCLWKDRSEVVGAHICYLVAEANFEPYSDSARLCLIGADHWKHPRTYASPEAIQRTELYEYSKVLGNSQFVIQSFQPYKLIYAYMLAEVGKISDSLKYCQAVLRSLKTVRTPEVEMWRQLVSSLEERLRTHQQGGYAANLAPAKLVGKLLNFFDSTAHRVVGGLPPPAPSSTSHANAPHNEHFHAAPMVSRVSTSQSTMAMSSLVPSSMEPMNADDGRKIIHNRSVSEPDFGRTPRQSLASKEDTSSSEQVKMSGPGSSRFGRFGFGTQLLQKTVGLLKPRSDKQAKLGSENKFYYDEKLKRWVEEGAEPPTDEAALPPPPTSSFQNGMQDYNLKSALTNDATLDNENSAAKSYSPIEQTSGMPPLSMTSNQFSARGRIGARARYVDTFNQGGKSSGGFHMLPAQPVIPAVQPATKFFVPSPAAQTTDHPANPGAESAQEVTPAPDHSSTPSAASMHRHPSMDNIKGPNETPPHSRRAASWSGGLNDSFTPPRPAAAAALSSMSPGSFASSASSVTPPHGFRDENLQEVEL